MTIWLAWETPRRLFKYTSGVAVRVFPEMIGMWDSNWEKTCLNCEYHHPIGWRPRWNKSGRGWKPPAQACCLLSLHPGCYEVSSLLHQMLPQPWYSASPKAQTNGVNQPWTETSQPWAKTNLSSFKMFFSGICHSNKKSDNIATFLHHTLLPWCTASTQTQKHGVKWPRTEIKS
jgi:hypothetical protein